MKVNDSAVTLLFIIIITTVVVIISIINNIIIQRVHKTMTVIVINKAIQIVKLSMKLLMTTWLIQCSTTRLPFWAQTRAMKKTHIMRHNPDVLYCRGIWPHSLSIQLIWIMIIWIVVVITTMKITLTVTQTSAMAVYKSSSNKRFKMIRRRTRNTGKREMKKGNIDVIRLIWQMYNTHQINFPLYQCNMKIYLQSLQMLLSIYKTKCLIHNYLTR